MFRYPKFATTVVGAHSVPDWFEPLDRLLAAGQLSMASMADAQPSCAAERDAKSLLAEDSGFPGEHAAEAHHKARSRRFSSCGHLQGPHPGNHRSRVGR